MEILLNKDSAVFCLLIVNMVNPNLTHQYTTPYVLLLSLLVHQIFGSFALLSFSRVTFATSILIETNHLLKQG